MIWRRFRRGIRALFHPGAADRDVSDEVASYLEQSAAEISAQGVSRDEARRALRLKHLDAVNMREQVRSSGWESVLARPAADLRYAARRLRHQPGFTLVAIATLALGIGASSAIFSIIESVLLKPLPYPHSEQLVALLHTAPGLNIKELVMSGSLYFTYSEESRVFQDVAIWQNGSVTVTGLGDPEQAPGLFVTHRFLAALGVQPELGRAFSPSDDTVSSERTVILSHSFWRAHYSADRFAIGRSLVVDDVPRRIIAVLPPSFQFMDHEVSLVFPMRLNRANLPLIGFCCQGLARLKPGVTLAQANADVARMLPLAPAKFTVNPGFSLKNYTDARIGPKLLPLKDRLVGDIGKTLWVLMGTVGIVLLIACANVANLLLVRADSRRQELAIRAALGASMGRIARELLFESVLLAFAGGGLGLLLAYASLRVLVLSAVPHMPRLSEISIDPVAVAFTFVTSLLAGIFFGLIPVFKCVRPQLAGALHGGGRTQSQSRERHRARSVLVIAQVALAVVLLVGSGLMIRTFQALRRVDPGVSHIAELETLPVYIPATQVKDDALAIHMEEDILRRLEAIPGVSQAAISDTVPLEGEGSNNPVYVEDHLYRATAAPPLRGFHFISPGYISTVGSRLVAGREFSWIDTYDHALVALVSENMARELWKEPKAALGKRIRFGGTDAWRIIIGVVADLRNNGVDQPAPPIVYWPLLMRDFGAKDLAARTVTFVIRTPRAGTAALLADLQRALGGVNSRLPVANVKTVQSVYDRSLARTTFTFTLLLIAGGMALLLGVIGLYGVISYSVAQRTREIGVRLALGASPSGVSRMFIRHGLLLSAVGAMGGLAGAFALTRLMKSLLYDVSPADPFTYAVVAAGLMVISALASYLPARMTTRIAPSIALRSE